MSTIFTFNKNERLRHKKLVDKLFLSGKSLMAYPIRFQYMLEDKIENAAVQILVSVPKKRFKRAVHRNLIKRRIKEAYRLNKASLLLNIAENKTLVIACIYSNNDIPSYETVEKALIKGIEKLKSAI